MIKNIENSPEFHSVNRCPQCCIPFESVAKSGICPSCGITQRKRLDILKGHERVLQGIDYLMESLEDEIPVHPAQLLLDQIATAVSEYEKALFPIGEEELSAPK